MAPDAVRCPLCGRVTVGFDPSAPAATNAALERLLRTSPSVTSAALMAELLKERPAPGATEATPVELACIAALAGLASAGHRYNLFSCRRDREEAGRCAACPSRSVGNQKLNQNRGSAPGPRPGVMRG